MNAHVTSQPDFRLPGPLSVAADMRPRWRNVDTDFDTAASAIVDAHRADGPATDVPVLNLRTWGVAPESGRFTLGPLAGHQPKRVLRATAFANLMSRIEAPVEFVRDRLCAPVQLAVTSWLMDQLDDGTPATLRLRGNEIAAIVSSRYAPLDQVELLECVRGALVQAGALESVRVRAVATGVVDVTTGERNRIERTVIEESHGRELPEQVDLYSFINAVTASAKESEPARRIEIEGVAGQLLRERAS